MATLDFIIVILAGLILGYFASSVLSFLTGSAIIGAIITISISTFIFVVAFSSANFDD